MLSDTKQKLIEESCKLGIIPPLLFAVTILTSLDNEDLGILGFKNDFLLSVVQSCKYCNKNGMDGIICSPNEVKMIREKLEKIYIATPGIRLQDDDKGDQKRISTPYNAIKNGADFIIAGRSVTSKTNLVEVIKKILAEIEKGTILNGNNKTSRKY